MKLKCGGVEGGWMQVLDLNMDQGDSCPDTWEEITTPRKLCLGNLAGCTSAHFRVKKADYINTFVDKLELIKRDHLMVFETYNP